MSLEGKRGLHTESRGKKERRRWSPGSGLRFRSVSCIRQEAVSAKHSPRIRETREQRASEELGIFLETHTRPDLLFERLGERFYNPMVQSGGRESVFLRAVNACLAVLPLIPMPHACVSRILLLSTASASPAPNPLLILWEISRKFIRTQNGNCCSLEQKIETRRRRGRERIVIRLCRRIIFFSTHSLISRLSLDSRQQAEQQRESGSDWRQNR